MKTHCSEISQTIQQFSALQVSTCPRYSTPTTVDCLLFVCLMIQFMISQLCTLLGFTGGASGKEPTCQCRRSIKHGFNPQVGKAPWRRAWQPTPVFLPGESHGQRSLAGYSPQGHKGSDMTAGTQHTCRHAHCHQLNAPASLPSI